MKAICSCAILSLLIASSGTMARADGITAEGMARSVSLFLFVGSVCPKFYRIDTDLAGRYAKAEAMVGEKTIGEAKFSRLMTEEVQRRAREIDATGPQSWCSGQKASFASMGLDAIYK